MIGFAKTEKRPMSENLQGDYIFFEEEGTIIGLFFRSPIKKIKFNIFDWPYKDDQNYSKIVLNENNHFKRVIGMLAGKKIVDDPEPEDDGIVDLDMEENNTVRYPNIEAYVTFLVSPIYFRRKYRKAIAIKIEDRDDPVEYAESLGYFERGKFFDRFKLNCSLETTRIKKVGFKEKKFSRRNGKFLYTTKTGMNELLKLQNSK